jgi:hypothetical protein
LVAARRKRGLWNVQQLRITTSPTGQFVLGFGEDPVREMHVIATDQTGPTGTTGRCTGSRATKRLTEVRR